MPVRSWFVIGAGCVGFASGSVATVVQQAGTQRSWTNASDVFTTPAISANDAITGWSGATSSVLEIKSRVGEQNLCVDVQGGVAQPGTNIQVLPCSGGDLNQRFIVDENSEIGQRIHWGKDTSFCLDVNDAGFADGVNVILMKCDGSNTNQMFNFGHDNGHPMIHSVPHWDKCLDVSGDEGNYGSYSGSNVQMWKCDNSKINQLFDLDFFSPEWEIEIKSRVGSVPLCVDVEGGVARAGTNIQVRKCSGANQHQHFVVDVDMTGQDQRIRWAQDRSFCIDVSSAGFEDGTSVILMKCDETNANQLFSFGWLLDGTMFELAAEGEIRSAFGGGQSAKCLDVATSDGTHYVDGSNLQIWSCFDTNKNQKFDIGLLD